MAQTKQKSKSPEILAKLQKLHKQYKNHGDSLKWFRSKKIQLLEELGYKTKEERDRLLESLKKDIGRENELYWFL